MEIMKHSTFVALLMAGVGVASIFGVKMMSIYFWINGLSGE